MMLAIHRMATLPAAVRDIDVLSDDEHLCHDGQVVCSQGSSAGPAQQCEALTRRPAKRKLQKVVVKVPDIRLIRARVQGSCGCRCNCFKPFKDDLFDDLVKMRKTMIQLEKSEQDNYAFPSDLFTTLVQKAHQQS